MSHPMRAAIYTRKSTTVGLDSEFNSLDNQAESCRAFIKARGWTEVPTQYRDGGYSGGSVDRPAFQRLLADAAAGKLDVIMVHRLDRFSRSVADFARLLDELKKLGVAVVSVTEGFDTSTAAGTLMINIIISMAQWEREAASERLKVKIAATRRKGLWTGGNPPTGFTTEGKQLVLVEAEATMVRTAFEMAGRGVGFTEIAEDFNGRGWRTRTGKTWTRQRLRSVLDNRFYVGVIKAGDEWVPGQHEALVDLETFERVQASVRKRKASRRTAPQRTYLLGGLIRCLACESGYRSTTTPGAKGSNGVVYYGCRGSKKGTCTSRNIKGEVLEDFVVDHIRACIDDGLATEVLAGINDRVDAERRVLGKRRTDLERQVTQAEADAQRLAEAVGMADNPSGRAVLQTQLDEAGARHAAARLDLADVEVRLGELDATRVDAQWVAEILGDWDRLWALLTPENRRRLMQAVVHEIRIDEPKGVVEVDLIDFTQTDEEAA